MVCVITDSKVLKIHAIRRGNGKHFTAKTSVCSPHLLWREDSRNYLNERIFARDATILWCLHGLLFIQQMVNILENLSIRCQLKIFLDFRLETAALKYNNSYECEWSNSIITIACLIILQAWPVKPCKNQTLATCLKNSPLTKVHWKN